MHTKVLMASIIHRGNSPKPNNEHMAASLSVRRGNGRLWIIPPTVTIYSMCETNRQMVAENLWGSPFYFPFGSRKRSGSRKGNRISLRNRIRSLFCGGENLRNSALPYVKGKVQIVEPVLATGGRQVRHLHPPMWRKNFASTFGAVQPSSACPSRRVSG